jgi:hypothetical protein
MKFIKNKARAHYVGLAVACAVGLAFSSTASAFTFENGWSCQNKWYQMSLIELAYCQPW